MHERLWFSLLGPVRAWRGADEVDLGSPQQRAALAVLLLKEGAQASVDELVDAVWGDDAPRSAEKAIRTYVYRLRRILDPEGATQSVITTVGNGYVMRVTEEECDLSAFRQELASADTDQRAGRLAAAAGHLRAALTLWQGTPLAGIPGVYAEVQRATLDRLRRSAIETRLTLDFRLGEFGEAVVELTALVAESPLDERFRELLMLALYRSGRQAEALAAYREGQALLADELGIDPGPGLRALYERILRADPALVETSTPEPQEPAQVPVPAQLPADLASFTGREAELALLNGLLPADAAVLVTTVIAGMAGVGKTTLAVHWAHQVAPRFPDGQLYVNLRGFEPSGSAMTATEIMLAVLDSLGVPPQTVPAGLDAQAALYRSLLSGRRMLILADNARDADQVRPLLPGTPGCLVIVTSRTQLPSLIAAGDARPVNLDLLPGADALAFLTNRLGPQRLAAEPDAARKIIDQCAGLPLALAIVAARAAINPNFSLASIATELRDSQGSLDAFTVADTTIDVRDVFSWSYRTLPPEAARLFRLLALHPGPDIATPAVASLAGLPVRDARSLLGTLTRSHLLTEHVPGRFTSHDLLRAYASELTASQDSEAERNDAVQRMLDHYLHTAFLASRLFSPSREQITLAPPARGAIVLDLADDEQAVAWFTSEQAVTLAMVRDAFTKGYDTQCWQVAWAIALFLDSRGHWLDLLTAQHTGLDAAERAGDKYGQAVAHRALGRANGDLSRFDDALKHLNMAFDLFGEVGDVLAQANIHRQVGWTLELRGAEGDLESALDHAYKSLELHRAAANTSGEAAALNAVGWYHGLLGQYESALCHCQEALGLFLESGERYGQADTWDSIGFAQQNLGDYEKAAESYRNAIALYQQLGVSFAEAETVRRLADTLLAAGDRAGAIAAWTTSLAMLDQLRHPSADEVRALLARAAAAGDPAA